MKTSTLLGLVTTLIRGRKFKMMAVGLQLGYMGFRYFRKREANKSKQISKPYAS